MIEPVHEHKGDGFTVFLLPATPMIENYRSVAIKLIGNSHTNCLTWAKAAGSKRDPGFRMIYGTNDDIQIEHHSGLTHAFDLYADGVLLTEPRSVAIIGTADCLSVAMYERSHHRGLLVHCGRAALTPTFIQDKPSSLLTKAHNELVVGIPENERQVSCHLTGSICATHFLHNDAGGKKVVEPFADAWGDRVFADRNLGQLDMVAAARLELAELGVKDVTHDGLCTFETSRLASYREHPQNEVRNPVIMHLH